MNSFRQRLGQFNSEKSQLNASLQEAQTQLKAVQEENETLKASTSEPAVASEESTKLNAELASVRKALDDVKAERDKAVSALEDEKAKKPEGATIPLDTAEIDARIVSIPEHSTYLRLNFSRSPLRRNGMPYWLKRLHGHLRPPHLLQLHLTSPRPCSNLR